MNENVCGCKNAIILDDNSLNRLVLKRMLESLHISTKEVIWLISFRMGMMPYSTILALWTVIPAREMLFLLYLLTYTCPLWMALRYALTKFAQLIRSIESNSMRKYTPIYGVSGGLNKDEQLLQQNNFTSMLIKPIDKSTIKAIVSEHSRLRKGTQYNETFK